MYLNEFQSGGHLVETETIYGTFVQRLELSPDWLADWLVSKYYVVAPGYLSTLGCPGQCWSVWSDCDSVTPGDNNGNTLAVILPGIFSGSLGTDRLR